LILELFFPRCIYIYIYVCVVIFLLLFLLSTCSLFHFSSTLSSSFLTQVGGHQCPENRNIEIVCIYMWIKAMAAVLSWFFNIFLIWIQEEWEQESFLFASLSIESIYTFYVHSYSVRFFVHILLMAAGFVCSLCLPFELKLRIHFLNNNNT
jgi:hypothetical protein